MSVNTIFLIYPCQNLFSSVERSSLAPQALGFLLFPRLCLGISAPISDCSRFAYDDLQICVRYCLKSEVLESVRCLDISALWDRFPLEHFRIFDLRNLEIIKVLIVDNSEIGYLSYNVAASV